MPKVIDSCLCSSPSLYNQEESNKKEHKNIQLFFVKTKHGPRVLLKNISLNMVINYFSLSAVSDNELQYLPSSVPKTCDVCKEQKSYKVYVGNSTKELLTIESDIGAITEQAHQTPICVDCRKTIIEKVRDWESNNETILLVEHI